MVSHRLYCRRNNSVIVALALLALLLWYMDFRSLSGNFTGAKKVVETTASDTSLISTIENGKINTGGVVAIKEEKTPASEWFSQDLEQSKSLDSTFWEPIKVAKSRVDDGQSMRVQPEGVRVELSEMQSDARSTPVEQVDVQDRAAIPSQSIIEEGSGLKISSIKSSADLVMETPPEIKETQTVREKLATEQEAAAAEASASLASGIVVGNSENVSLSVVRKRREIRDAARRLGIRKSSLIQKARRDGKSQALNAQNVKRQWKPTAMNVRHVRKQRKRQALNNRKAKMHKKTKALNIRKPGKHGGRKGKKQHAAHMLKGESLAVQMILGNKTGEETVERPRIRGPDPRMHRKIPNETKPTIKMESDPVLEEQKFLAQPMPLSLTRKDRNSSKKICPDFDKLTTLLGPLQQGSLLIEHMKERDVAMAHRYLMPGGHWKPESCVARYRIAIIIPFRDRQSHLTRLIDFLAPILKRQYLDFRFIVTEQYGSDLFNKGRIMNAAFRFAEKLDVDCIIFHDVDLFPQDDRIPYGCPEKPLHIGAYVNSLGYQIFYKEIAGGVLAMSMEHYRMLNGYSNMYWSWGGEDDDMGIRILAQSWAIIRLDNVTTRYTMLKHMKRKRLGNNLVYKLLDDAHLRWKTDGLNVTSWKVLKILKRPLYYHMYVDVGESPEEWREPMQTTPNVFREEDVVPDESLSVIEGQTTSSSLGSSPDTTTFSSGSIPAEAGNMR